MQINSLLNLFNLSLIEKEVFRVCLEIGLAGATMIARKSNISRTSVYDILSSLIKSGLIFESQAKGIKVYGAKKPEAIELLINEKEKGIIEAKKSINDLKNIYANGVERKPRLQIFSGREELRQMMKDMLLYRDITAYVLWPVGDIIKLLGKDFYEDFQKKRVERNIKAKVIWPMPQSQTKINYDFLRNDVIMNREARLAPKNFNFTLGYAVYNNTVRFISPKENYGFLIESLEMAELMRHQFELIWKSARKI